MIDVFAVEVAVIVAEPTPTAVTVPWLTRATLELEVLHVTVLIAPLGEAVTLRLAVPPTESDGEDGESDKDVGETGALTVIEAVALIDVLVVEVAVIVAVPWALAVTRPLATEATLLFELLHVTEVLAPLGEAVTVRLWLAPMERLVLDGESDNDCSSVDCEQILRVLSLVSPQMRQARVVSSINGLRL